MASKISATEECFEKTSRSVFKFNMVIDRAVIGPVAKGYNKLPESIKNGTSNFTSNVATLLSIPNHVLQGNIVSVHDVKKPFKCEICSSSFTRKPNFKVHM